MSEGFSGYPEGTILDKLHRMHAPINMVVAFGSMLMDGTNGPLTDDQQALLEKIVRSGETLAELATEMAQALGSPLPPLKNPGLS